MAKYYVVCGDLRAIVLGDSAREAAITSLEVADISTSRNTLRLGHHFEISERGFESPPSHLYKVENILREAGWEWEDD